ncbi:MAG: sulfurtransferase [Alphaproteobacteria bacterium]|nr:sulfurtransferase [Alphaproteobacteria bacterium]MCB9797607.1 sulfurtransferase [Alphaproteobacteria bacterium]
MIKEVLPFEVAEALARGEPLVIVDVREDEELHHAALAGVVHIPLGELGRRAPRELDPDARTIVMCHHGVRSLSGAALLEHLGFEDVASMRGGISLWADQVDPTVGRY